jgi:hypothetical protein
MEKAGVFRDAREGAGLAGASLGAAGFLAVDRRAGAVDLAEVAEVAVLLDLAVDFFLVFAAGRAPAFLAAVGFFAAVVFAFAVACFDVVVFFAVVDTFSEAGFADFVLEAFFLVAMGPCVDSGVP